jgi:uncharacterized protein YjiS (DUF1127 family)
MSMHNDNEFTGTRAGVMATALTGVSTGLFSLASGWSERAERRRVTDQLNALTDRELTDIGLTRGDIPVAIFWSADQQLTSRGPF